MEITRREPCDTPAGCVAKLHFVAVPSGLRNSLVGVLKAAGMEFFLSTFKIVCL